MHPSWAISLTEGTSVLASSPSELVIEHGLTRFVLRANPSTQGALVRLAWPGEKLSDALGRLSSSDPQALARYFHDLRRLAGRRWLEVHAYDGRIPLATLTPDPRRFLDHEDTGLGLWTLSRFAHLRRAEGAMIFETPLAASRVVVHDPRVAALACALSQPIRVPQLAGQATGLAAESVESLVAMFFSAGLLTSVDETGQTAEDRQSSLLSWEFHDLVFHARSRQGRHAAPSGNSYRFLGRLPQPPAIKPAAEEGIMLVRPDLEELALRDPPLVRVMESRRSIREYDPQPICLDQLAEFLYRVARVRHCYDFQAATPQGPIAIHLTSRPYPTGGALYALEVYAAVRRCEGLPTGLYHYDPLGHRLEPLCGWTPAVQRLSDQAGLAMGQPRDCVPVLLVLAARFQRVSWKYASLAYSLILKDAGVMMQTMYLAAEAMQLAPCAIGVGDSDLFASALGSDYYAETSVGEFALGLRKAMPVEGRV